MALTELLAALEGERRTHAAAVRAGSTRQEATMREPTMREPDAHAGASEPTAGVYGASFTLTAGHPQPPDEIRKTEHQYSEPQDQR
jgi:hypothetical protein